MTTTPATQPLLPVTPEPAIIWEGTDDEQHAALMKVCAERRKRWPAETPDEDCDQDGSCEECTCDMADELETKGSLRRRLAYWRSLALAALTPSPCPGDGMRENDKPPAHWAPDDQYADRQPQTPEEWDWRADGPDNGALSRSIKRLNYGADRADPHTPDQMATVLRIDLMRVTSQLVWLTAKTEMYGKILAERNALRDATKDVIATADDYYTARNGRRCSIEGEDGEKCWIVPFDPFQALRAALTPSALSGDAGEDDRWRDELEELLEDIEDEWIDHYLRPDSAARAKCTRCGGDDFDKTMIEHKPGCLVGRIRAALPSHQGAGEP